MDLKEEGLLGGEVGKHWYYRAKLAAVAHALGQRRAASALDVGAGLGFFARALLGHGHALVATCVDPFYSEERDEIVDGKSLRFRRKANDANADLILMMDVLEHVDDDVALLREYVVNAPQGALFLITVPAFQWLWSGHDVFLEHRRRYTLAQLEAVVKRAGLTINRGYYFYAFLFPLVAGMRLFGNLLSNNTKNAKSQMRESGKFVNFVLWTVCRMEIPMSHLNRIAGLTALVVATKH